MRTTILVPCFNETEGVPHLCGRLRAVLPLLGGPGDVELLFVDDGSTDGTAEGLHREAAGLPHRIVSHERNRGLGAALRTGFAECRTEELVVIDSDCSYDPTQIADLLAALRAGADLAVGSCYHPRGSVDGVPKWRLGLSWTLSRMYSAVLGTRIYTYTSCFRAYRRDILERLDVSDSGFLSMTQILVSALVQGARVVEVPARLTTRQYGQSKIKVASLALDHLGFLLKLLRRRLSGTDAVSVPVSAPVNDERV